MLETALALGGGEAGKGGGAEEGEEGGVDDDDVLDCFDVDNDDGGEHSILA